MKRKKQITCLLLTMVLILAGLVSGCGKKSSGGGSDSGDGKTLTMMCVGTSADPYLDAYKNVVETFNENNELGVTVNIEFYENEQYKTKLTTLMASNSVPDLFFTWELSYLKPFVEGGKVADLTSYLDADEEWKNSFGDGTLEQLTFNDKVYAIPTQKSLCVMFYNKKIFEENNVKVPETWDEFLKVCETLKTNGVTPMAMCGSDAWIPAQFVQQISNGIAGLDLYNGICDGSRKWNDSANVEAADELQKMVDAGYFQNGFIGMGPEESTALFKDGKAAMYFQGAWDCNTVYTGSIGEDAGVFVLPAKNPEYNNISVGSVDTSFAIAETCKNKDAAVELLKYWSSAEVEQELLYSQGRMPAGVFHIDESKLNPLFAEALEASNSQVGLTPWWDRAFGAGEGTEFNNTCVSVCGGENTQECFDALQQFAEDNADR
ncbi:MAG: extracellular solute-binding protein [Lachnospiraceae bacterium]|nr:extracellular solute-binding protein [Lachnospiraceae bacterium]